MTGREKEREREEREERVERERTLVYEGLKACVHTALKQSH